MNRLPAGPASDSTVEAVIREYLKKELNVTADPQTVKRDTNLFESKVLDSLSLVKLVLFLEQKFGMKVEMEDMVPDNFSSIESISTYLHSHQPH